MSLAAEHGHVTRMRVIDDALHQAGLADAGFPLDHQRRRSPLAELTDYSRRQAEFGLPPHEPLRRGHPQSLPHAQSFPPPPAPDSSRRPIVSVCVSFTPVRHRSPAVTGSCLRSSATVADTGERRSALLESVLGATLASSNLASSATLTRENTDRRCQQAGAPRPTGLICWSQF